MSIDARVNSVIVGIHGEGYLALIDRPNGGTAGQSRLYFESSPPDVISLNNLDIWGNSEIIMLGTNQIAKRIGYTRIKFVSNTSFTEAIKAAKNVS